MPRGQKWNPILKSLPDSEKVNAVSEGAALLYCFLICATDDGGRYWGDPQVIALKLFTSRMLSGEVRMEEIASRLEELERVGLLRRYRADGRIYLELADLHRPIKSDRTAHLNYPEPEGADSWIQAGEVLGSALDPRGEGAWIRSGSTYQDQDQDHTKTRDTRAGARQPADRVDNSAAPTPGAKPPDPRFAPWSDGRWPVEVEVDEQWHGLIREWGEARAVNTKIVPKARRVAWKPRAARGAVARLREMPGDLVRRRVLEAACERGWQGLDHWQAWAKGAGVTSGGPRALTAAASGSDDRGRMQGGAWNPYPWFAQFKAWKGEGEKPSEEWFKERYGY